MKTKITALLIATLVTCSVWAQEKKTPPTAEERAKHRTERMKEKLALTPDQETKLNAIYLKEAKEQDKQREEMEKQRAKDLKEREAREAEVKSVLTADQQTKYEEMKKKRHHRGGKPDGRHHARKDKDRGRDIGKDCERNKDVENG